MNYILRISKKKGYTSERVRKILNSQIQHQTVSTENATSGANKTAVSIRAAFDKKIHLILFFLRKVFGRISKVSTVASLLQ